MLYFVLFGFIINVRPFFIVSDGSIEVEHYTAEAGNNMTLPCPGINEHSLVHALEWRSRYKLAEYVGESTTVWENKHRISLLSDTFALHFHPVTADDSGFYVCLVNNRPKPDAVLKLTVHDVPDAPGRPLIMSFTSRSVNLSWAPPPNTHSSPVTHYIIQTRVGEEGQWNEQDGILTPNNETSYQVTKLQPFTVYRYVQYNQII